LQLAETKQNDEAATEIANDQLQDIPVDDQEVKL
jgi:hypothetical protein